jgi:methylmalonyl-CoA/ethylmalonyl-CoA epimerase
MVNTALYLAMPRGYEFHHIGYATHSVKKEKDIFSFLGYSQEGDGFIDHAQGVSGCFLIGPGPRLELLENLTSSTTLSPWLTSGIKIYHFAYLVDNIIDAIDWSLTQKAKVVSAPTPSIAFQGKKICFVMFRNGLMLEYIDR